ncbi:MAG: TatD family hydrolase, partial [Planctomycetia bacterium]
MVWVDTHSHLNHEAFAEDADAAADRAAQAGVGAILVVGIDAVGSRRAVEMAALSPRLYATVGIHPNSAAAAAPDDFAVVERLAREPRVVAVGETGLDRYWDHTPFAMQEAMFQRHLELGREHGLPVVIHCRDAETDVARQLEAFASSTGKPAAGVLHSFAGGAEALQRFLSLGLYISFAGMATFKKSDDLRATAALA